MMSETNIIIIGSGIAGLYYAYKKMKDKNFIILEKNNYIGGRVRMDMFHNYLVNCGAGVGRFNKDILLKKLLQELKIPIKKMKNKKYYFPEETGQSKFINNIINSIKDYNKKHPNYIATFKDIILKLFDKKTLNEFIRMNGYGDFINEDFRQTINYYGLEDNYMDIDIFPVPWNVLVNKLVNIIGKENIKLNYTVKSIQKENNTYTLYTNKKIFKNIKEVIIATDISSIYKFFPNNALYKYIEGQPFSRIYALVDKSSRKIIQKYIKGYTIVNGPLQKIIPISIKDCIYMIGYNDNENADLTKNITKKKLISLVNDIIGEEINIIDFKVYYWNIGTHYFKPYNWKENEWTKYLYDMQHPVKNIKVIGEAFSFNQGWVEGALESVHSL
jgi:hypothetical protein